MKLFYNIIKVLIFLVFLLVALSNTQTVPFFYLPKQQLDLPLIAVLFGAFVVGALFGVFAMFGRLLRLRAESNRLRREVAKSAKISEKELAAAAATAQAASPAVAVPAVQPQASDK